jgi:hypothetical protein
MTRARLTGYVSYPTCCFQRGSADDNKECDDFSGCEYLGDFANGEHLTEPVVKCRNLAAFFDKDHPTESYWAANYKDHTLQVTACVSTPQGQKVKEFTVKIVDTCADRDCSGCCTENAGAYGKLLDLELNTLFHNIGNIYPDTVYYKLM